MNRKGIKKKVFVIAMALCMFCILMPSALVVQAETAAVAEGTCGDELTWVLDDEGTLTISGTGDMTSYSKETVCPWYTYRTQIKKVVVENGVTSISQYAFYSTSSNSYSALESVSIAGSVKTIGTYAFGCGTATAGNKSVLTTLILEDGIEEIGTYAFSYCKALTEVTIPDSVTTIGNYAFNYCTNLETLVVGSGVTSMGARVFANCTSLSSLTLKEGITEIGGNAFQNCTSLTTVTIPDSVTTIGDFAFYGDKSLSEVTLGSGLQTIGSSAFSNCTALEKVTFAENSSLTSIGDSAFNLCSALVSIELPDSLESLGQNVFYKCTALVSIVLPEKITEIPYQAFRECTSLTSVMSKGTITSIRAYAFYKDTALATIFDLSSVTEMAVVNNKSYAFGNCSALTGTIDLSSLDNIPAYAFYGCKYITGVTFSDNLITIGDYAFRGCNRIEELDFPDTLTSIGAYAFYNNWLLGNNKTTTVESGAAVTHVTEGTTETLEQDAEYSGWTLVIPDSVTYIGNNAFAYSYVYVFDIGTGLTEVDATAFASYRVNAVIFDNMEEDVSVTNSTSLGANKDDESTEILDIVYLQGSVGDVDDTISDEDGAMTLQEAVYAVVNGTYTENGETTTTITISKNIKLTSTLIVPEDFNGTITTEDGESYIIIADSDSNLDNLIEVAEGADITFSGDVILNGKHNSGSVIYTEGSVTLDDNATVTGSNISDYSIGVIDVVGSNAKFTMNGGIVEDNTIDGQLSGVICASEGGTIIINDGVIQNNKASDLTLGGFRTSSGIMLYGDSYAEMNGGTIQGNTSFRGAAVYVYSNDSSAQAKFVLNDGTITGNTSPKTEDAAGAVYLEGNASFTMNGGTISDNYGQMGGGVSVVDYFNFDCYATFTMNGGTISNNSAHAGGGIYSFSNGVTLNAGYITGNTAHLGGGVYSEGNADYYGTVQMNNVLITDNSAEQGGGMWFCPTGIGTFYVTNGGAVVSNTAEKAGDDIVFATGEDTTITLADRILGGGKVEYYKDGNVYVISSGFYTSVGSVARYNDDSEEIETNVAISDNVAAIAITEESAEGLAEAKAQLYITGNTATYGGGVGSNGGVTIGVEDTVDLTVTKTWDHKNNPESNRPQSITLKLINTYNDVDYVIETVTVEPDDNGDLIWTFYNLPADGNYSVEEVVPDYYKAEISDAVKVNGTYEVNITNTYNEASLTVEKTVTGNYGDKTAEFNFTVTLSDEISGTYGDMTFEDGVATFTLKDGESVTATGLPAGVSYTVVETEADADGYTTTIKNAEGTLVEDETAVASFTNDRDVYTEVNVTKVWEDDDDQDGKRPESITINLYADDKFVTSAVVTEDDDWAVTFSDLPKYDDGVEIEYTVTENYIDKYDSVISGEAESGYVVTNTYEPVTINIEVAKTFDVSDKDGETHSAVTVVLYANGVSTGKTITLSEDNNWYGTFSDLARYENGEEIEYTIKEKTTSGDISIITGSDSEGFTITTYVSESTGSSSSGTTSSSSSTDDETEDTSESNSKTTEITTGSEDGSVSTTSAEGETESNSVNWIIPVAGVAVATILGVVIFEMKKRAQLSE